MKLAGLCSFERGPAFLFFLEVVMSGAVLRAKMSVSEVTRTMARDGSVEYEQVALSAVYAEEGPNAQWTRWTPSADFNIRIDNPNAIGKLSSGHEYYVDFVPVPAEGDEDE